MPDKIIWMVKDMHCTQTRDEREGVKEELALGKDNQLKLQSQFKTANNTGSLEACMVAWSKV